MTTTDKANDSAQRATGKAVNEAVGEATDDDKLWADAHAVMERNLRQAGFKK